MAADSTFTANTEMRIQALETGMNKITQLLRNLVNLDQFNKLNVIRQQQYVALDTRLQSAEALLSSIESSLDEIL